MYIYWPSLQLKINLLNKVTGSTESGRISKTKPELFQCAFLWLGQAEPNNYKNVSKPAHLVGRDHEPIPRFSIHIFKVNNVKLKQSETQFYEGQIRTQYIYVYMIAWLHEGKIE